MDLYLLEPFGLWFISATLLGLISVDFEIKPWKRAALLFLPLAVLVQGVILIFSSHQGLTTPARVIAMVTGALFYWAVLALAYKLFGKLHAFFARKAAGYHQ